MPRRSESARADVSLAEVLALLDFVPQQRHGQQLRGPCPLHRSSRPRRRSFAAHVGKNVWYCFRCNVGGNALDRWAAVSKQPLHAAVCDLYQRLGRALPLLPLCPSPSRETKP